MMNCWLIKKYFSDSLSSYVCASGVPGPSFRGGGQRLIREDRQHRCGTRRQVWKHRRQTKTWVELCWLIKYITLQQQPFFKCHNLICVCFFPASRPSVTHSSSSGGDADQKRVRTKLMKFLMKRPTLQSVKEKGYIRGTFIQSYVRSCSFFFKTGADLNRSK